MNIRVINSGGKIVMKLRGDLDGSSAWEIIRKVDHYKDKKVALDFSETRHVYPFGWHTLKSRIGRKVALQNIEFQTLKKEAVVERRKGSRGSH